MRAAFFRLFGFVEGHILLHLQSSLSRSSRGSIGLHDELGTLAHVRSGIRRRSNDGTLILYAT
jgi:hypothetical protein